MNDIYILGGLLVGFVVIGPVACWLLGVFNPIGYMGRPPWASDVKEARKAERERRRPVLGPDGRLPDGSYLYGSSGSHPKARRTAAQEQDTGSKP